MFDQFEITRLTTEQLLSAEGLLAKVAALIRESFSSIEDLYDKDDGFVESISNFAEKVDPNDQKSVFYITQDTTQKVIAVLWAMESEEKLYFGKGNLLYSKYLGVIEEFRGRGIGTGLKKALEEQAIRLSNTNGLKSLVISRVLKTNSISAKRNEKNGYQPRDDKDPKYIQYYKEIGENNILRYLLWIDKVNL